MHLCESVSDAFDPLPADVGIHKAHIERLVAHRHHTTRLISQAHTLMPVVQAVDRDPTRGMNFDGSGLRRGTRYHQKVLRVGDQAMRATPGEGHSLLKSFTRALAEGGMLHLVIDLVDILRQAGSKAFQGPDREPVGIDLAGHVPWRFARLEATSTRLIRYADSG